MSEKLVTAFSPWPPDEIAHRAITEFNSREVGDESPWTDVLPVIRAYLRHDFTNYDDFCRAFPERHDELREQAYVAMQKAYPVASWRQGPALRY